MELRKFQLPSGFFLTAPVPMHACGYNAALINTETGKQFVITFVLRMANDTCVGEIIANAKLKAEDWTMMDCAGKFGSASATFRFTRVAYDVLPDNSGALSPDASSRDIVLNASRNTGLAAPTASVQADTLADLTRIADKLNAQIKARRDASQKVPTSA